MADRQHVGFIGLGQMGEPMATNVAAQGIDLTVFDTRTDVTSKVAHKIGARQAESIFEVGEYAPIVVLSLPNGQAVRDVVLGTETIAGLVESLQSGSILIDMSSSEPNSTRSLGDTLRENQIYMLDAPVSGGVKKATTGMLTIMTGGDQTIVESLAWLFDAIGEKRFYTGPLGSGHAMKALNNYVSAAGLVAASEAVRVGSAFGIDSSLIVDILNGSTGRNNSTENKFHQYILPKNYASGFSLGLMAKDVKIASNLARRTNISGGFLEICTELWGQASVELGADADHTEFIKVLGPDNDSDYL